MAIIDVSDFANVGKWLGEIGRKQLPFAASLALNMTANQARDKIVKDLPDKFQIRGKWSRPGRRFGINVKTSSKRNLIVYVHARIGLYNMKKAALNGQEASSLLIPTRNVKRGKGGKITKASRPRGLKRSFVIQSGGQAVLYRRRSKKVIEAMYVLESSASIKPILNFNKTVNDVVHKRWQKNFDIAFDRAMRTAK